MRFAVEVVKAVRERAGSDFIIIYRLSMLDLVNDGSHPEREPGALLAARGDVGEVVNVGHAMDMNEPVYIVDFGGCVVGCLEIELAPVPRGWTKE